MPEIDLTKLYAEMQKEMLQKLSTGANAFEHAGTKGDNSESNWISWFQEYLPNRYSLFTKVFSNDWLLNVGRFYLLVLRNIDYTLVYIGKFCIGHTIVKRDNRYKVDKGIVIDSTGKQSEQIDLIIYDAQYSYLVFRQNETLLIPAESVYAVFEVKQNLNKNRIEYAGAKAKSVRALQRTSAPIKHAGGEYPPKELHEILAGVLTTRCDWKAPITDMVVKHVRARDREERLDFVCSISNNTFVVENNTFMKQYDETSDPEILYCGGNESLVYLLLNLLRRLRDIGTAPAIDFSKYAEKIASSRYEK